MKEFSFVRGQEKGVSGASGIKYMIIGIGQDRCDIGGRFYWPTVRIALFTADMSPTNNYFYS